MINQNKFGKFLDKYGSIAIFSVMILVFCVTAKGFLTPMNGINILVQTAPTLIMALGCTFVNMAGESDLSLGGIVGLSASLFCGFISKGHSVWLAGLVSIGAGALFGALNGFLVSYVGLSSFITTISVMFLTQGLEYAYSGGSSLWVRDNPVTKIVTASVGPIPIIVIATVLVFILVYLALHRTRAGLHIQAVGRSQDAAKFAGIHVKGIQFLMFVLAGVFYALGGVINALRSNGAIIYSGQRLLLPVLAVTYIAKNHSRHETAQCPRHSGRRGRDDLHFHSLHAHGAGFLLYLYCTGHRFDHCRHSVRQQPADHPSGRPEIRRRNE